MFRKRSDNFACETMNFACERSLFRRARRKPLKSLEREIAHFADWCDFKWLRPILFRGFPAVRFLISPLGLIYFLRIHEWHEFCLQESVHQSRNIPELGADPVSVRS
jgi:hypothetical protein